MDRKTKEKARILYLADHSVGDISSILNIHIDTVRFYVFGENGSGSNENCWFQIKKQLGPSSIAAYLHDKIGVLDKICGTATSIVNENLTRIKKEMDDDQDFKLSLDDTRKLAGIAVDMDKIIRLESGQATAIVENIGLSRAEAIRILAEDPFANAIEVNEDDITHLIDESDHSNHPDNIEDNNTIKGDVEVKAPWK